MSEYRLMFFAVVLTVFFTVYVGYRFYENRAKSTPAAKEAYERIDLNNRAFLDRTGFVSQLPRTVTKWSPSLTTPVWAYTPEKWASDAVNSVKITTLVTDVVGFHAAKLPDGNTYRLPLPKEKALLNHDTIADQELIYLRIFTTPENTPELPLDPPILRYDDLLSEEPPISYPLIAKFLNTQDDASLTALRDWIKSVGGAARAQSLIEAAGLADSIRIETVTIHRE